MNKIKYTSHNWLAQKINNCSLQKNLYLLKGRVIDLGCGTKPYEPYILASAREYIGLDWSSSFHDLSNVDIIADLTLPLPLQAECADTVVCFQVLEHLSSPKSFLAECYRILRPEGKLFITVPFMWHVHEAPYDYYRYTRYGLEYMLLENQFSALEITENTGFWQMWILKFNYHTVRYAKGLLKLFWIPVWWLGQTIAPTLDKIDPRPGETGSYTVIATK